MSSRDKRILLQQFGAGAARKAAAAEASKGPKPTLSLDFQIGEFKAEDMLMTLIRECSKQGYFTAGIILDPLHRVEPKIFGVGTPELIKTLLAKGADLIGTGTIQDLKTIPNKVN